VKRPRLRPPHVRNAVGEEPASAEVEEALPAVQVLQHPLENAIRQFAVPRPLAREETDRLRRRMDVDRVDPIVVVLRRTVFQEESVGVVFHAPRIRRPVLRRQSSVEKVADRLKIETRVKRIHPFLDGRICVEPRAILPLMPHGVLHAGETCSSQPVIVTVACQAGENRSAQQVCIVYRFRVYRRIAETERPIESGSMEIVKNELLDRDRHLQRSFSTGDRIAVEQRVSNERGIDNGRRTLWTHARP